MNIFYNLLKYIWLVIFMLKNLKKLRNENNVTQQQLADAISVSQQSINKYENHNIEPDISTLIQMADYFNVTVDYLIGRTGDVCADKSCGSSLSRTELQIINKIRLLNKKQKDVLVSLIDSYLE